MIILVIGGIDSTQDTIQTCLADVPDTTIVSFDQFGEIEQQRALELKPDVVLIDRWVIGRSGVEVVERIGGLVPTARLVLMTVSFETDILRAVMRAGVKLFLAKPIDCGELLNLVQTA